VGVLLRFVVAAFSIMTLTLVAAVGVSAGSRGFGTSHGSVLVSGQLANFLSNGKHHTEDRRCQPERHHHHPATPPHECEDEDENGD
jgi:hypothetical protein